MAQVSLYLGKEIYGKVETAAHLCGESVSKYVATIIQDHFDHEWPSDYAELFGSISDDSFFSYGAEKIMEETARESL
jgi:hypothetical protein